MALKGGENRTFAWKNFDHSIAFVMLKTTFSKHQLIKINITNVDINPEVDTKMIQEQWLKPQTKPV